jgi:hypothetical protein
VETANEINMLLGVVVLLAVLSAMWTTITGFVTTLSDGTGPEAALADLIPFFLVLGVVLGIIYGALRKARE